MKIPEPNPNETLENFVEHVIENYDPREPPGLERIKVIAELIWKKRNRNN